MLERREVSRMDRFTGAIIGLLLASAGSWYVNKTFENAERYAGADPPAAVLNGEAVVQR